MFDYVTPTRITSDWDTIQFILATDYIWNRQVMWERPEGTCIHSPDTHVRHICGTNKQSCKAPPLFLHLRVILRVLTDRFRTAVTLCSCLKSCYPYLGRERSGERGQERERGSPPRHRGWWIVAPGGAPLTPPLSQRFNVSSTVRTGESLPCCVPCLHTSTFTRISLSYFRPGQPLTDSNIFPLIFSDPCWIIEFVLPMLPPNFHNYLNLKLVYNKWCRHWSASCEGNYSLVLVWFSEVTDSQHSVVWKWIV